MPGANGTWLVRIVERGVTIIADFQEVTALRFGQGTSPNHRRSARRSGDPVQKFGEAAVDAGDGQIAQQPWGTSIERGEAIADGFLRQSTG